MSTGLKIDNKVPFFWLYQVGFIENGRIAHGYLSNDSRPLMLVFKDDG